MKRRVTIVIAFLVLCLPARAQSFELVETTLRPTLYGALALGDYDNDGDLDVLVSGTEADDPTPGARIYRNDGPGAGKAWTFSPMPQRIPADGHASFSTGDYDGDGDLDLLMSSQAGVTVYRNDGAAGFTALPVMQPVTMQRTSFVVEVVRTPTSAWGDYDNDGDLDILVATSLKTQLYRNDGNDRFTAAPVTLPRLANASLQWGDYDNDGDLDILAAHRPLRGQPYTTILRNDRFDTFSNLKPDLPGIQTGSVTWGDYDNDSDLDILIVGGTTALYPDGTRAPSVSIFRNTGGTFTRADLNLPFGWYGAWQDFDSDGDLDILLNGTRAGTVAVLLRNDRTHFTERLSDLKGVWFGATAFGDLDGDGQIDALLMGQHARAGTFQRHAFFYRNTTPDVQHHLPQPPTIVSSTFEQGVLEMNWEPAADRASPGHTYNLRVGTRPGAGDVLSAMARADGGRLLPAAGNAGHSTSWSISGLDPGQTYYWSVQTVDQHLVGSSFAPEQTIARPAPAEDGTGGRPGFLDNYPNPFNPTTTISYTLPTATQATLTIYNVLGAEVARLASGAQAAGRHEVSWDGRDAAGRAVPSGIYLYRLATPAFSITKRMLLVK